MPFHSVLREKILSKLYHELKTYPIGKWRYDQVLPNILFKINAKNLTICKCIIC